MNYRYSPCIRRKRYIRNFWYGVQTAEAYSNFHPIVIDSGSVNIKQFEMCLRNFAIYDMWLCSVIFRYYFFKFQHVFYCTITKGKTDNKTFICFYDISAVQSSYKARRGGTVGLFPFPRVGRAQFGKSWQVVPEEFAGNFFLSSFLTTSFDCPSFSYGKILYTIVLRVQWLSDIFLVIVSEYFVLKNTKTSLTWRVKLHQ